MILDVQSHIVHSMYVYARIHKQIKSQKQNKKIREQSLRDIGAQMRTKYELCNI